MYLVWLELEDRGHGNERTRPPDQTCCPSAQNPKGPVSLLPQAPPSCRPRHLTCLDQHSLSLCAALLPSAIHVRVCSQSRPVSTSELPDCVVNRLYSNSEPVSGAASRRDSLHGSPFGPEAQSGISPQDSLSFPHTGRMSLWECLEGQGGACTGDSSPGRSHRCGWGLVTRVWGAQRLPGCTQLPTTCISWCRRASGPVSGFWKLPCCCHLSPAQQQCAGVHCCLWPCSAR